MASLGEAIASESDERLAQDKLEARNVALRAENGQLRKSLRAAHDELERAEEIARIATRPLKPPRFLRRKPRNKGVHTALLGTTLSDMHFDEVVKPEQVHGLGAYDRDIAVARLARYYEKFVHVAKNYWTGVTYTGIVAGLGGDGLSGDIHDLKETNDDTSLSGMFFWADRIAAGYEYLLAEFPDAEIYAPCMYGNHPRLTDKPASKNAARNNFDWGMALLLATHFKDEDRIRFEITEGMAIRFDMHDVRFLFSHGDVPRSTGGRGVGGIWPTIKGNRAKLLNQWGHDPFDYWLLHHYHTYIPFADGIAINGSLKGTDEWSLRMGFTPERAQQAMWQVTPEQGITNQAPVIVTDRKAEGW